MASNEFRMEHDFLGDREVPADAYYGVQTLRGKENFHICGSNVNLTGVNSNVIMSGCVDDNPDDARREAARDNSKSV